MINPDRLWDRLMRLSDIGKQESGGITRLSFTPEERAAKDLVRGFMLEAGLAVREDEVGNLIGRKEGGNPEAPVVLVGSHIDSVFNGGNFDGPLGVLAGVEILHAMNEQGIATEHPIEVIAFTDEEGTRFSYGMIGSRGIAGLLERSELEHCDKDGISIAEAMRQNGLDPDAIGKAARPKGSVKAYVELHIEQGKVLESRNLSVGVVSGVAGPLWVKFILEGEAGHAGATPMTLRRDPLAAAAEIMLAIEQEAGKTGTAVGTVGQLQAYPGGVNIIPGKVEFSLDLRDVDQAVLDRVEAEIVRVAKQICEKRGIQLAIELLQRIPPVICSEEIQQAAKDACESLGFEPFTMPSGAGHDCMQLTGLCPVGMIFARSQKGISHNPAEYTTKEDCADGANVLYRTVLSLAGKA
ncbi:Zn-dependent hydrolase [Brevibacillus borstelensis]|uniref:Zn-dependent hydrolase n=1 Tax=Brevibacillus borstelensis TaxID=45462 RepID=UPI00046929FC|nr:Zn-dependent hydrolase [Brevibacillus borstelensis]KKX55446.1 allantoate amidohydrolase [Brevibacillus borstelensis cifa_chp40]MED1883714.1 Zn-dependent hydrolase [Brevibacillus borstelensis]RNB60646.1 Zn-dependent hydrolase [Brevibacillus borstelensis]GED51981.1 Zn-dependent hydrolase [Brevibacillus borstelensis]